MIFSHLFLSTVVSVIRRLAFEILPLWATQNQPRSMIQNPLLTQLLNSATPPHGYSKLS